MQMKAPDIVPRSGVDPAPLLILSLLSFHLGPNPFSFFSKHLNLQLLLLPHVPAHDAPNLD